ncbi:MULTISPECIES: acyl carrier protein [unclassified Streptomyces]|uniref:acyl carrier protein n=1 Tax=unclassified Streptomyces TaxID=2593676 RepID=UPI000DAEA8F1|nr:MULTISPECIES: acyl carrier protein [unclassified Streptomyces]PZT71712.1 acyl carrier protein [Streptomyces sp. AC1-42T]PZT73161.1 acyl carrier protein [Streptomyces sp. AC1-42W]
MSQTPWNAKFEKILQQGLPGLGQGKTPDPDAPMESYGLDSMALIALVGTLESSYGVSLAGEVVVPVHTLTAGQLWGIVSAALQPSWDAGLYPSSDISTHGRTPWAVA